ncbi:acetylserotonin O-methyltransferase-like [Sceloporus undulatus]|uniref:acetylserotonin O-methyltransferase-like n=1 Tax=Sceloporus undulatus TaxID=8520 RepID=UPI001C4D6995|nr:acetylserotonin O-methyltransferase-like [Sceloporus undulatus]
MDSTEESEMIKILLQYQHGFFISKVLLTASELGVFDLLLESGESQTSTMIAERLNTSPIGMERLLETCVGLKLLRMERKGDKDYFGNTKFANLFLAKSSPKSQYNYLKLFSEIGYSSFQYLTDAVREGKNQLESIHGPSTKDFFQAMYSSEEKIEKYFSALGNTWSLFGREVVSAFDLSHFPTIYDLGGGSGVLAKECTSLYPNSTVTIFDLPQVVERANKHFVASKEHRITFQEGNFFKDPVLKLTCTFWLESCTSGMRKVCAVVYKTSQSLQTRWWSVDS